MPAAAVGNNFFAGTGGRNGSLQPRQLRRHAARAFRQNLRRDHHDELGLLFFRRLALEQRAENRDVADAGNLLSVC